MFNLRTQSKEKCLKWFWIRNWAVSVIWKIFFYQILLIFDWNNKRHLGSRSRRAHFVRWEAARSCLWQLVVHYSKLRQGRRLVVRASQKDFLNLIFVSSSNSLNFLYFQIRRWAQSPFTLVIKNNNNIIIIKQISIVNKWKLSFIFDSIKLFKY